MILGTGVDICPVAKLTGVIERQQAAFVDRVFTATEQQYATCAIRFERLAARWAAKEAAIKALGAPKGMKFTDAEVNNDQQGAPSLRLYGAARDRADQLGVTRIHLSLSHAGGIAIAMVVLEGPDQ